MNDYYYCYNIMDMASIPLGNPGLRRYYRQYDSVHRCHCRLCLWRCYWCCLSCGRVDYYYFVSYYRTSTRSFIHRETAAMRPLPIERALKSDILTIGGITKRIFPYHTPHQSIYYLLSHFFHFRGTSLRCATARALHTCEFILITFEM